MVRNLKKKSQYTYSTLRCSTNLKNQCVSNNTLEKESNAWGKECLGFLSPVVLHC